MSLTELHRLKVAWETEFPRQACGGETAMLGFSFQFGLVLLDSVRAWLAATDVERTDPRVYGEYLSDIAELKSTSTLLVTQVKFSQSSAMVTSALGDLYLIYKVAEAKVPMLLPKLEMRILSARSELKHVAGTIERWSPPGVANDDTQLVAFKAKVRAEIQADPLAELLALLANKFQAQKPLAVARAWLGKLLEAAGHGHGFAGAAREVWNDLIELDRARLEVYGPSVYVWTADDQPPQASSEGQVLTGQQPQVHHLRGGFFAPRPALLEDMVTRVSDWAFSSHSEPAVALRLPLFWIGGRSGAGKSVLLLQVLARLHESSSFTILFLPSAALLPAAIRWSHGLQRSENYVVIAVDDPYAPATQSNGSTLWGEAIDDLHALRQAGDPKPIPLVLCCGPTEQADRLRGDFSDDIALTFAEVPHESRDDLADLRLWYLRRTGKNPPEVGDENILLVQLFFEWRVEQTIPEFATRFRKRIVAADPSGAVFEALAGILALNRLYVGACRKAVESGLAPALRDVLERLLAEEHLVDHGDQRRPGLWLSHPHLAEAIYTSWFPSVGTHLRRHHLVNAASGALTHGATPAEKTAPIWAVTGVLGLQSAGSDLLRRLDSASARGVLSEVHSRLHQDGQEVPLPLIPVWLQAQRLDPDMVLNPDPMSFAIRRLETAIGDEQGLRLVCHKLLEFTQSGNDVRRKDSSEAVVRLLERLQDWHEWLAVAHHAVICVDDEKFWSLVASWVELHVRSNAAQHLLLKAIRASGGAEPLLRVALSALHQASLTNIWSQIAVALLRLNGVNSASVMKWFGEHREDANAALLLEELLALREADATDWALAWCQEWHLEASAEGVLKLLFTSDPPTSVINYACAWIAQRHEHSGFLMKHMLDHTSQNHQVQALGIQWLDWNPTTAGEWGHVWTALWRQLPGEEILKILGRTYLDDTRLHHGSWGYVWKALWDERPGDEALAVLARKWLGETKMQHGSWAVVWQTIWDFSPGDSALASQATEWLNPVARDRKGWGPVCLALLREEIEDPVLPTLSRVWLREASAQDEYWPYIWLQLCRAGPTDESIVALGMVWLGKAPAKHKAWALVWDVLRKVDPSDQALAVQGKDWLREAPTKHRSWLYIWSALRKDAPEDRLLAELARKWLSEAPSKHKSWGVGWLALWNESQSDEALIALAKKWLSEVHADHAYWSVVWQALRSASPSDSELADLAKKWLSKERVEHATWSFVWQALWNSSPGDDMLAALAKRWLSEVPAEHRSWNYVWHALWKAGPGDATLATPAMKFLSEQSTEHASWSFIWQALWNSSPGDDVLVALAKKFLSEQHAEHASWPAVWQALWNSSPRDDVLAALGKRWLSEVPAEHRSWNYIWQALWKASPRDETLRARAVKWLSEASAKHGEYYVRRALSEAGLS